MMTEPEDVFSHLRAEFAPVRMDVDAESIGARGRSLRRRRRAATVGGAGLMVAAVTAGLMLGLPGGSPPAGPHPRMQPVAWSVESAPDGTVDVTIWQLFDAERLSVALRQAGVPAKVEFKQLRPGEMGGCAEAGRAGSPYLEDVVTLLPGSGDRRMSIRPRMMPSGATLHLVIFQMPDLQGLGMHQWSVLMSLVDGDPLPCTAPQPLPSRR